MLMSGHDIFKWCNLIVTFWNKLTSGVHMSLLLLNPWLIGFNLLDLFTLFWKFSMLLLYWGHSCFIGSLLFINLLDRVLGGKHRRHKKQGQFAWMCPFCNHYKPKLEVNILKSLWHCWVCDKSPQSENLMAVGEF